MPDPHTESLYACLTRVFSLLRLPPRLTVSEWADKYRYLSSESAEKHGKWRSLPFQIEPMNAIHDRTCGGLVLMWAAQYHGKTEILMNVFGYLVSENPCPILMIRPNVDDAKSWSKKRLMPMIRDTPRLHGLIAEERSRDSLNTIQEKTFPGGLLKLVGANAPSGLASTPVRILMCDETDRFPESAGTEGDPISLGEARLGNFSDAFTFKTSTPTVKGFSKIEYEFEKSDKRYWFCPCPHCGTFQTLRWKQVRWDEGKPETAWYECEKCKTHLDDIDRLNMIQSGEWRPTAEYNGIRGYHLNGIYHMFPHHRRFKNRLHQMVVEFLEHDKSGTETLKTWINTFLAECWEEKTFRFLPAEIESRVEKYKAEVPAGVLFLVGSVDLQTDRLEYQVVGFGVGEEAWTISYQKLYGNPHLPGVWKDLDEVLKRTYSHEYGYKMRVSTCFIDSGGQFKKAGFSNVVYDFVKPRQGSPENRAGIYACKGIGGDRPLCKFDRKSKTHRTRGIYLMQVGSDEGKSMLYGRLQIKEPGPRFIHFPNSEQFGESYFRGLVAEEVREKKHLGKVKREWVRTYERNEPLDLWVYCLACLSWLSAGGGIDWRGLQAKFGKPALVMEKVAAPAPAPEAQTTIKRLPVPQPPQRRRHLPFRRFVFGRGR